MGLDPHNGPVHALRPARPLKRPLSSSDNLEETTHCGISRPHGPLAVLSSVALEV